MMNKTSIWIILSVVIFTVQTGCSILNSSEGSSTEPISIIENKGSDTIVNLALAWAEE